MYVDSSLVSYLLSIMEKEAAFTAPLFTPEFVGFVRSLLTPGGLNPKNLAIYTNDENIKTFREAFIHKSFSRENSYETLEFLGDVVLNLCVADHFMSRFARPIINVEWLTKMKHYTTSKKILGQLSISHGFNRFLVYGQEMIDVLDAPLEQRMNDPRFKKYKNKDPYLDMLEDTVEAFLGAIVQVTKHLGYDFGLGVQIAKNITDFWLNKYDFPINYHMYFDPVSQLNDIYGKFKWPLKSSIRQYFDQNTGLWTTNIFGYLGGDRTPVPQNEKLVGTSTNATQDESRIAAAILALKTLKANNISYREPNPYTKK